MTKEQLAELKSMDGRAVYVKYKEMYARKEITMDQMGRVMDAWIRLNSSQEGAGATKPVIMMDDPSETIQANFGGEIITESNKPPNPFKEGTDNYRAYDYMSKVDTATRNQIGTAIYGGDYGRVAARIHDCNEKLKGAGWVMVGKAEGKDYRYTWMKTRGDYAV